MNYLPPPVLPPARMAPFQGYFILFLGIFCMVGSLAAFPPAPYYTLYGMVRDEVGQTVTTEGAVVILLKDGSEVSRTPIQSGLQLDQNYELNIRIDQDRSGTEFYTSRAIPPQGQFSLAVQMNGSLFYPIEVEGTLTAGNGGERVRLNLTLGQDTDGDELPDTWEEWMLYQAGYFPDANGVWPINLITRNGDFDEDGLSNWLEYLAGTFAGDATDRFFLEIRDKTEESVRLEFYAITGKTYTIERSADMETWERVPFAIGAPAAGAVSYRATDVAILSAFVVPTLNTKEFFRLTVR